MIKNNITRSPLVVGFMAVAMGFQSPAGHDAIYQGLLRGWFAMTWVEASIELGRPISFRTFRENAELLAWDPDPDIFINNMRLLNSNFSFCLPFTNDGEERPDKPQNFACHVAATRDDKKNKKGLAPSVV